MALANMLVSYGYTDGEIARILIEAPYPKNGQRSKDYLIHTIRKARTAQDKEEEGQKEEGATLELAEVKEVFAKWLVFKDTNVIDVSLAAVVCNYYLNADPLWVLIVAPSSSAKTEIIKSLDGCKDIYLLSNLTKATLISGHKSPEESSLLPKLTNKILCMKDFTTILEMRDDDKAEILAQLREIYDGKYDKAFGTGKVFSWKGHVGLLAGVTSAIDDSYSVKQVLGERFIFYRPLRDNVTDLLAATQAMNNTQKEGEMRTELHNAMKGFLLKFSTLPTLPPCPKEIEEQMNYLALVTAVLRSGVPRDWSGTKDIKYVPMPESPPRLAKQLMLFTRGLALVRGKEEVTEEEYKVTKKIALDTIPAQRKLAIQILLTDEWLKTKDVASKMRYPNSTTKRLLEDLNVLYIVDCKLKESAAWDSDDEEPEWKAGRKPYEWSLNLTFHEYIGNAGISEEDF